jgi:hypothetical protein
LILSLLLATVAGMGSAHVAEPAVADPHVFSDAAMTFTAPLEARPEGAWPASRTTPGQLSADPLMVAAWVIYPSMDQITLEMESYKGPPSEWEAVFEAQLRGAERADTPFFSKKTQMRLRNGMPATFVEIDLDSWSKTTASKVFAILWADGRRGIVLSETMPANGASADKAKRDLGQVKAVDYP